MKPSEKITKRKYAILQNKLSNSKVKALSLEYELESVKKDLIREPYRGGKDTPVYDYTYSLTQFFANCLAIDKESQ